jgi:hypothetical protein
MLPVVSLLLLVPLPLVVVVPVLPLPPRYSWWWWWWYRYCHCCHATAGGGGGGTASAATAGAGAGTSAAAAGGGGTGTASTFGSHRIHLVNAVAELCNELIHERKEIKLSPLPELQDVKSGERFGLDASRHIDTFNGLLEIKTEMVEDGMKDILDDLDADEYLDDLEIDPTPSHATCEGCGCRSTGKHSQFTAERQ